MEIRNHAAFFCFSGQHWISFIKERFRKMMKAHPTPKSESLGLIEEFQYLIRRHLPQDGCSLRIQVFSRPVVSPWAKPARAIAIGLRLNEQSLENRNGRPE